MAAKHGLCSHVDCVRIAAAKLFIKDSTSLIPGLKAQGQYCLDHLGRAVRVRLLESPGEQILVDPVKE